MPAEPHPLSAARGATSRRDAVAGSVLLAALATTSLRASAAAQATPGAPLAGSTFLVQSFGRGSLFPTQGDVGVLPWTAILWDAAERGFLSLDPAGGSVGVATTEAVLSALAATSTPPVALLITLSAGEGGGALWALRLAAGLLGSDPDAVTYQGEPLSAGDAPSWLGAGPPSLPDGPQELGAGYLVVADLPGV